MPTTRSDTWCDLPARPGTYVLLLQLDKSMDIRVGRRGRFKVPRGWYLYVGSARGAGGLRPRVRHHWQSPARPHWHIDFLRRVARPVQVMWRIGIARRECEWAATIAARREARMIAFKFGASDCNCPTHLYYFPRRPSDTSLTWAP